MASSDKQSVQGLDWVLPAAQLHKLKEKNSRSCLCLITDTRLSRVQLLANKLNDLDLVVVTSSPKILLAVRNDRHHPAAFIIESLPPHGRADLPRLGLAHCLQLGYEGVILVEDTTDLRGLASVPDLILALAERYDCTHVHIPFPPDQSPIGRFGAYLHLLFPQRVGERFEMVSHSLVALNPKFLGDQRLGLETPVDFDAPLSGWLAAMAKDLQVRTRLIQINPASDLVTVNFKSLPHIPDKLRLSQALSLLSVVVASVRPFQAWPRRAALMLTFLLFCWVINSMDLAEQNSFYSATAQAETESWVKGKLEPPLENRIDLKDLIWLQKKKGPEHRQSASIVKDRDQSYQFSRAQVGLQASFASALTALQLVWSEDAALGIRLFGIAFMSLIIALFLSWIRAQFGAIAAGLSAVFFAFQSYLAIGATHLYWMASLWLAPVMLLAFNRRNKKDRLALTKWEVRAISLFVFVKCCYQYEFLITIYLASLSILIYWALAKSFSLGPFIRSAGQLLFAFALGLGSASILHIGLLYLNSADIAKAAGEWSHYFLASLRPDPIFQTKHIADSLMIFFLQAPILAGFNITIWIGFCLGLAALHLVFGPPLRIPEQMNYRALCLTALYALLPPLVYLLMMRPGTASHGGFDFFIWCLPTSFFLAAYAGCALRNLLLRPFL